MAKRRSRFLPGGSLVEEALEPRLAPSGAGGALPHAAAEVAARPARPAATKTTLAVGAGTLGQPIAITATVRAAAEAGSPTGTVKILDHGRVLGTLTLAPATAPTAGSAAGAATATATLVQPAGDAGYALGKHQLTAEFIPGGAFAKSTARDTFTVSPPAYTTLAGGVKVATVAQGSGPAIQSGQTANVLYTGYLAQNGKVFDDSANAGGAPFGFTLGSGQVVTGFEAGTVGMKVGETRVIAIPPAEGYGAAANGEIPGNSTLIFLVTLQSIA